MSKVRVVGGVVQVDQKPVKTRYGTKQTYSFKLDDGEWYRTNFKPSGVAVGDLIEFEYEEGKYGRDVDVEDIFVRGKAPVPAEGPVETTTRRPGRAGFPVPPLAGERAINRQNALTNAVKYADILAMTSTKPTIIMSPDEIIKVARKFEAYTTGDLDMAAAVKEVEGAAS